MKVNYFELFGPHLMTVGVVADLYRRGELGVADAARIELGRSKAGISLTPEEEEISLSLPDDYDRGGLILDREYDRNPLSDVERETLLIADLIRIRATWSSLADPPSYVESSLEEHALDEKYGHLRLLAPMRRSEKTSEKYAQRIDAAIVSGQKTLRDIARIREAGQ